jgi:hypothetical protein
MSRNDLVLSRDHLLLPLHYLLAQPQLGLEVLNCQLKVIAHSLLLLPLTLYKVKLALLRHEILVLLPI